MCCSDGAAERLLGRRSRETEQGAGTAASRTGRSEARTDRREVTRDGEREGDTATTARLLSPTEDVCPSRPPLLAPGTRLTVQPVSL